MGLETLLMMIPKGGKYAKSVVNFVHKAPKNWEKFKSAIQQITDILKSGKLRLDGKQKTIFESNKNILKNHEKVTKKVEVLPSVTKEYPPFNVSKEDFTKGWTPTLIERSKARNIYKELDPPASKYTKEMEAIDEELDALAFGGEKYERLSSVEKAKIFKKLQAEMKTLIKVAMKDDLSTLSLSQLNKKSHDLQRRIREIANNPDIKGTVYEGPKKDMIAAIYDSENAALTKARHALTRKNSELKYGKTYPVLDPENDMFIVIGLDERGSPIRIGRTIGKFRATKDKTGELTSAEGTSFYDKWNAKTGTLRKEGEEVFTNTLNREGKEIMSNPDYKIPKTENMDIQTEFYTDLSTSDLFKKGYKLKDIDMIVKGRKVREYLEKTKSKDTSISMQEQTSTNEIGAVLEDLYHRGDDIYKMSMEEWITKIPEYFAEGGRTGFHRGSLRHQKTHDWKSYQKEGPEAWGLYGSPPENWLSKLLGVEKTGYHERRDDLETYMKERFMYGEKKQKKITLGKSELDKKINAWIKELFTKKKRNEHATGGISNLFRERQGFRTGNIAKIPEFIKFVEGLLIKASNQIRQGLGKWKGLTEAQRVVQHDNLTKLATNFQKTKKFDKSFNEYFGIDAEKAFIEAQAKVKATRKAKDLELLRNYQEETGLKTSYGSKDSIPGDEGTQLAILKGNFERKYTGVIDDILMKQVLADNNPQRISEIMATIDQSLAMQKKGMSSQNIMDTLLESWSRKKQAEGGLIPGYATGGVSNLFRSR